MQHLAGVPAATRLQHFGGRCNRVASAWHPGCTHPHTGRHPAATPWRRPAATANPFALAASAGAPGLWRRRPQTSRKIADKPHPSCPPSRATTCNPRSCEHPNALLQGVSAHGSEVCSGWVSGCRAHDGRLRWSRSVYANATGARCALSVRGFRRRPLRGP